MLALVVDVVVAWLLVRYVPPGWKQLLLGLLGGWLAAIADTVVIGLMFGWPPIEMLSRLTTGLLVHPLIVAGFAWLITRIRNRGKPPADIA